MALNENLKTHLTKVHEQTKATGFTFLNPKSPMVSALLGSGHLEADTDTKDPTDAAKVAMRLSAAGVSEISPLPAAPPTPAFGGAPPAQEGAQEGAQTEPTADARKAGTGPRGPRVVPVIARSGLRVAMPAVTRGGNFGSRPETYPFSSLQPPVEENGTKLHDSFFVHATAANPNPAKSLAGTVSSATKRYKDEGRKFSVVSVDNDAEFNAKGARVFRIS